MTILHVSDLHLGKPHLPRVADAVVRLADETDPAVVVVSGDLTQRAKAREYRAASRLLRRFARPLVVTAGNHDVPLYRVWERAFAPHAKYREHISERIDTVLDARAGPVAARFVALSTAAPRSAIVNGRLAKAQLRYAERAFAAAAPDSLRVLVVHHNLVDPGDARPAPPLRGARRALGLARRWGVDLILSGHIHRAHLGWAAVASPRPPSKADRTGWASSGPSARPCDRGLPVVIAGTASSSRGRAAEARRNTLNLIRVERSELRAVVYLYSERQGRFLPSDGAGHRRRYTRRRDASAPKRHGAGIGTSVG